MLSKLIKTTKYLAGWVSWSIIYPAIASEKGQRQLVDICLLLAKKHPKEALAIKREIEELMQDVVDGIAIEPEEAVEAPIIASDVSGRHAPPKPAPRVRHGRGSLGELKARLGLKRN